MKVYLVENVGNCPGRVQAVFAHKTDADAFCNFMNTEDAHEVVERTLFYGQPPWPGYNE